MRSLLRSRQTGGGRDWSEANNSPPSSVPRLDAIIAACRRGGDGGKLCLTGSSSRVPLGSIMLLSFCLRLAERWKGTPEGRGPRLTHEFEARQLPSVVLPPASGQAGKRGAQRREVGVASPRTEPTASCFA